MPDGTPNIYTDQVSIQLGSPARGDISLNSGLAPKWTFPFNWVPLREGTTKVFNSPSLKPKFPFNWVPLREGTARLIFKLYPDLEGCVSIQLGSPARGDFINPTLNAWPHTVSIQLGSPARGDNLCPVSAEWLRRRFPFNWVPLREGTNHRKNLKQKT